MASREQPDHGFVRVAEVEIESVRPVASGFDLRGLGGDRAEYRLDLDLEMPLDQKTRTVLGELLAQSRWRVWRRAPQPLNVPQRARERKPVR